MFRNSVSDFTELKAFVFRLMHIVLYTGAWNKLRVSKTQFSPFCSLAGEVP